MIKTSDLALLGWTLEKRLPEEGVEMSRRGYIVQRWKEKIVIYRKDMPCPLFQSHTYSYFEMEALMKGLRIDQK